LIEVGAHIVKKFQACHLVSLNGSAGSFDGLLQFIEHIPAASNKIWLYTIHRKKAQKTQLIQLLQHHSKLPVKEAEDKEALKPGKIYVSPSNYHLLLEDDFSCELDAGEPVHFCRPSIDVLLESLARTSPELICAILFSGANGDGGEGMLKLHDKGGLCLVQDPADAQYPAMPQSALDRGAVHLSFSKKSIPELLKKLHQ